MESKNQNENSQYLDITSYLGPVELVYLNIEDYGYYHEDPKKPYDDFENTEEKNVLFLFEKFTDYSQKYVQGIFKGKEVDMQKSELQGSKNLYDFTPKNTEKCVYKDIWVREIVYHEDLSLIPNHQQQQYDQEYLDNLKKEIYSQPFIKFSSDRDFTYGGACISCKHVIPLYFSQKLDIKDKARKVLKKLLNEIGDHSKDFHETCPVQDIVDPELNPNYSIPIENHQDYQLPIKDLKSRQKETFQQLSSQENNFRNNFQDGLPQTQKNNEYVSLRSKYQWIPTKFLINKDKKVKILGQIHNLPRENTEKSQILYKLIEHVFEKQLPAYEKLNLINFDSKGECILQVVFKAQKYIIQPGQKYSGKWHLEGKTENIVAAGVYYISIDEGFSEDQLQFKPLISYHHPFPYDGMPMMNIFNIDIEEGSSLVFSNTLPHRFATLTNETEKPLERLFMNFFIVDPAKPILDTEYIQLVRNYIPKKVNNNISKCIFEYLGINVDIEKAKERRKIIRENSHKEVSGWGYIHYGNSGDVEFIDSFAANINYGQRYDIVEREQQENQQQQN